MNCEKVALLLDDRDVRRLGASERVAVQAHVAACAECARAWRVHARLVDRAHAPMRRSLPDRVWQALREARVPPQRRFGGPVLLGLLVAGAVAAAAMFALDPPARTTASLGEFRDVDSWVPNEIEAQSATNALPPFEGTLAGQMPAERAVTGPPKVERFIVLPTWYENPNPAAVDDANATRAAFLKLVREHTDAVVVELTAAQEASVPRMLTLSSAFRWLMSFGTDDSLRLDRDRDIAAYFQAYRAVRFASRAPLDGSFLVKDDSRWAIGMTRVRGDGRGGSSDSWKASSFGESLDERRAAEYARRYTFADPSASGESLADRVRAERARRLLLDTFPAAAGNLYASAIADARIPEDGRVRLLREASVFLPRAGEPFPDPLIRRGFDAERIVAMAIDLGRSANSLAARRAVWSILGPTGHPAAAQPLMDALRYDGDAGVRSAAADGLQRYQSDPVVAAVLQSAAAGDASSAVRRHARWTLMSEPERAAFIETARRDASLPAEERVAILDHGRRAGRARASSLDDETVTMLESVARSTRDPELKAGALRQLTDVPEIAARPEIGRLLLENLNDPDIGVRLLASLRLASYHRDDPAILEAVRRAHEREPDEELRLMMEDALAPAPPPTSRLRWPF